MKSTVLKMILLPMCKAFHYQTSYLKRCNAPNQFLVACAEVSVNKLFLWIKQELDIMNLQDFQDAVSACSLHIFLANSDATILEGNSPGAFKIGHSYVTSQ